MELPRKLGLFSTITVLIGSTIGSGIFRSSAGIAARIPDERLFFAAWIIGGVCVMAGALTYAELASALPRTGGVFVYLREAFGSLPAFLFGWAELTIVRASALGAIATVFAEYLVRILGVVVSNHDDAVHYIAAASILLVAFVNFIGVHIAALIQNLTATAKYLAVLLLVLASFLFGGASSTPNLPFAGTGSISVSLFGLALISVLWAHVNPQRATSSVSLGKNIITRGEGENTTYFSVVDAEGNAVSSTYTLEDYYGSRVIPKGTGFLLNNEMHDFNLNPGVTDTRGLIGTNPNLIQPGKRMLSSMAPTIVLKDRNPFLVTGSPGGRTIINTVLQVNVNVIDFKMDAQEAVDEPRIHHQWLPDAIALERPLEPMTPSLRAMGNQTRIVSTQGDAHSILIKNGKKYAGVDHRTRGGAAGY